jgi:hypothetical protein
VRFANLKAACALVALLPGCRAERYFGPYSLQVPSSIMEMAAARTFQFPLDDSDLEQADELAACLEAEALEPTRETPCICDFPIVTISEQQTRVDYRLSHRRDQAANVLVWVGYEVEAGQVWPDVLPDFPQVEVMGEHHHHVAVGDSVNASFLEDELWDVDRSWASIQHFECEQDTDDLPSATEMLFGLALESEEPTRISVEFTFRVREDEGQ